MPVTRSAHKKMRRDERKRVINVRQKRSLKTVLKQAQTSHAADSVRDAISKIDKAVKNGLMHANKAARLKSQLMRTAKPAASTTKPRASQAKKTTAKKAAPKKAAAKKPPAKKQTKTKK